MAVVELTREQLLDAVRQLPEQDRIQIVVELLSEADGFPQGDAARKLFKRLRGKYRMDPEEEQEMSLLLAKANEGTLSAKHRRRLDELLDESQERMLQLALAVMLSGATPPRKKSASRRGSASPSSPAASRGLSRGVCRARPRP